MLYDVLTRRLNYFGDIDIWNVTQMSWAFLSKETDMEVPIDYTTLCVRASTKVTFMLGLGWEIAQLECQVRPTYQEVRTDVEVCFPSDLSCHQLTFLWRSPDSHPKAYACG